MVDGPSKVSSTLKSAAGAVKENVAAAFGNKTAEADGAKMRAEADAEYKAKQGEQKASSIGNSISGNVRDAVGGAIGNEEMQAKGKADKVKSDAQDAASKV